jgi:uncharacterized YceG family protein
VADRGRRTAEEREAARLERERRRAARRGEPQPVSPPPPASQAQPRDPEAAALQPASRPEQPEPVSVSAPLPSPSPHQPSPGHAETDADPLLVGRDGHELAAGDDGRGTDEYDLGTGEYDLDTGQYDLDTGEHDPVTGEYDQATGEHDLETGEHLVELPSGTKRVSARDKQPVPPPLRPRKQRKLRPPAKPRNSRASAATQPRERRRRRLWLVRIASLLALAVAAAAIWFLIQVFQPFGTSPHGRLTVTIPAHATSGQIGDTLARDGVISSSFFFGVRATLDGDRSDMRPGVYHLQLGMSYASVLKALTTAPPAAKVTEFTITEGRRRKQIDQLLRAEHVRGSYLAATRSTKLLDLRAYGLRHKPPSLEGFLFPDTYQLVQPVHIQTLVDDQLRTFKKEFAKVDLRYARRHHLTPYDVLIIASLIEGETPTAHDRPLVSSVIYNRLADGMMLQLDSTTQYATGNFTRPLTVSQLHSGSPYNTRTHLGLPPTPINNPGLASIQAAAHPAQTKYLFFFGKPCQRGSVFATNYSQFLNLGAKYQSKHC